MHAIASIALALASSVAVSAAPAPISKDGPPVGVTPNFKLWASGENLEHWAVVNAHVEAGRNVLEIQRPTAYTSNKSYIFGTPKDFNKGTGRLQYQLGGDVYTTVIETPEVGELTQVYTQAGGEGSKVFSIDQTRGGYLDVASNGEFNIFWACETEVQGEEVFTLWYGAGPTKKYLKEHKCESITLQTHKKW
ncbi:uncharacterized protein LTR77_006450 [Saxophila tyrrhenica]|uniref:Uncharacterized protein n=1 Tax=Saxophila tyrrhenica TaxID=1690608 RepID=A0AAV9P7X2_9PEZI|nr:hypothetical protein LTR77_006450 [Saxophila tyrrhenica]